MASFDEKSKMCFDKDRQKKTLSEKKSKKLRDELSTYYKTLLQDELKDMIDSTIPVSPKLEELNKKTGELCCEMSFLDLEMTKVESEMEKLLVKNSERKTIEENKDRPETLENFKSKIERTLLKLHRLRCC